MGQETEQIKERLDIVDIVGEYVQLKRAGKNFKALCPFHQEKTPSFIVSPDRNSWYCFGCNEGGDIFTFVERVEGVDFRGALKMLAERAGVQLTSSGSQQSSNRRQRMFDLLQAASQFYHGVLFHDAGIKAREYLVDRCVTEETMQQFTLGYAPNTWDTLQQALRKRGFTNEEIEASGLVGRSQRGTLYDRFRGRIMFPISDTQGRVVAFGGRIAPWNETGNEGKYINSPETELYEKRRVVYNLSRAKSALRKDAPCIVVEGYMDVIMLTQAGMDNVVASSGTAFTDEQVRQIQRFTNALHFAFDADAAGWRATVAATDAALARGMHVATIVLPAGTDPADAAAEDPAQAQNIMQNSRPLTAVLLEQLTSAQDMNTQEEQLRALVGLVRRVRNPIQQGTMIQEIAQRIHVPESQIYRMLEEEQSAPAPSFSADAPGSDNEDAPTEQPEARIEQHLLGIALLNEQVRREACETLSPQAFVDSKCQMLYNAIQRLDERNPAAQTPEEGVAVVDEDLAPFAEGVRMRAEELLETTSNTPEQEGRLLVRAMHRRALQVRLRSLQQDLAHASSEERDHSLQQFQELTRELAQLDSSS